MASVTHGQTLASTSNLSAFTTTSFTPTAGDLLVVFVAKTASVNDGSVTDSLGGTYTLIRNASKNTSADRLQLFVANQFASGSAMTVTYDCTGDATTGCIILVERVAGMGRVGSNAVSQNAAQNNQAGGGTPAPVFSFNCITTDPTLGCVFNATNPAGLTAPTGWTILANTGYATPTSGAEDVSRDSGFTGTTITWGSVSGTAFCDIIVELDASIPPAAGGSTLPLLGVG